MTKVLSSLVALALLATGCSGSKRVGPPSVKNPNSGERLEKAAGDPCKLFTLKELKPLVAIGPSVRTETIFWGTADEFTPFSKLVNAGFCEVLVRGETRRRVAIGLVETLAKPTFDKYLRSVSDEKPFDGLGDRAVRSDGGVVVLFKKRIIAVRTYVPGDTRPVERAKYLASVAMGGS